MSHPTCAGCSRSAVDRITVRSAAWEPDLKEVRPGVWKCWACREEQHPDMPENYLPTEFKKKVRQYAEASS